MYVINNNTETIYEIKKSKFITKIYYVDDINSINNILSEIKDMYKDATHICYAYKINNIQKFSDDGEPGGTAGLPIIEVLNKKNITNCLAIVIRYFGGIKLGAGGLVRAYTSSVINALSNTSLLELTDGYKIELIIKYEDNKEIEYILKNKRIISKNFEKDITYILEIEKDDINLLDNYNYKVLENIKIPKK